MRNEPAVLHVVSRRRGTILLAICWFSGILFGLYCFWFSGADLIPLMRSTVISPVSIVGFLLSSVLPFLISAFLAFAYLPGLTYGICFCSAFLHAFVSLGLLVSFQAGGWLVRCFLLLGNLSLPVLYWFWLRSLSENSWSSLCVSTIVVGCILTAEAAVNYRIVIPYFARIMDSMKG